MTQPVSTQARNTMAMAVTPVVCVDGLIIAGIPLHGSPLVKIIFIFSRDKGI
jgi:hypothetical protein